MERIISPILRVAELAFAAIVAGINGKMLDDATDGGATAWDLGRYIYAEVVAGVAIFLSLIWLVPFAATFTHWPVDIFISLCWWAAFGLLVDDLDTNVCGGVFTWSNISLLGEACGRFKAVIAFSFLSALLWLVSAILGFFWTHRKEGRARRAEAKYASRRRWYHRSYV